MNNPIKDTMIASRAEVNFTRRDAAELVGLSLLLLFVLLDTSNGGHCGATSTFPKVEATHKTTPFVQPKPAWEVDSQLYQGRVCLIRNRKILKIGRYLDCVLPSASG